MPQKDFANDFLAYVPFTEALPHQNWHEIAIKEAIIKMAKIKLNVQ